MGDFANGPALKYAAWACAALVIALNGLMLVGVAFLGM